MVWAPKKSACTVDYLRMPPTVRHVAGNYNQRLPLCGGDWGIRDDCKGPPLRLPVTPRQTASHVIYLLPMKISSAALVLTLLSRPRPESAALWEVECDGSYVGIIPSAVSEATSVQTDPAIPVL